ncbi:MAG: flagellar biosynthesis protein FlgB [Planctomycetaceae bacterium]
MKPLFDTTSLSLLEKIARFGERRHEVLAGNIANINTPHYRMRDLPVADFREALEKAVITQHQSAKPTSENQTVNQTQPKNLFPETLFKAVEAAPENLTFQDANNRSVEVQMMELTKNNMMQRFAIELMRLQYNMLQTAITERP